MRKSGALEIGDTGSYRNKGTSGRMITSNIGKEREIVKVNGVEYIIITEYLVQKKIDKVLGSLDIQGNFVEKPYECALGKEKNTKKKKPIELIKVGKGYKTIDKFVNSVNRSRKGQYGLKLYNGFQSIQWYDVIKKS